MLRKLFEGGNYSREETICGNTVVDFRVLISYWIKALVWCTPFFSMWLFVLYLWTAGRSVLKFAYSLDMNAERQQMIDIFLNNQWSLQRRTELTKKVFRFTVQSTVVVRIKAKLVMFTQQSIQIVSALAQHILVLLSSILWNIQEFHSLDREKFYWNSQTDTIQHTFQTIKIPLQYILGFTEFGTLDITSNFM